MKNGRSALRSWVRAALGLAAQGVSERRFDAWVDQAVVRPLGSRCGLDIPTGMAAALSEIADLALIRASNTYVHKTMAMEPEAPLRAVMRALTEHLAVDAAERLDEVLTERGWSRAAERRRGYAAASLLMRRLGVALDRREPVAEHLLDRGIEALARLPQNAKAKRLPEIAGSLVASVLNRAILAAEAAEPAA